jgi:hypothetical protein
MGTPRLTGFDEIEIGHVRGPVPWRLGERELDAALSEYEQWRLPFVTADAAGRRIIPPCITVGPSVVLSPYRFRGIAAGVELHNRGLLYQDADYTLDLYVDEKYEKRGRNYVWFRATFTDEGGEVVHEYRWLQVLSPVASVDVADVQVTDVTGAALESLNEFPYLPPAEVVRDETWTGTQEDAPALRGYLGADAPVGLQLQPVSALFSWVRARDYAERRSWRTGEHPNTAAYSVHSSSVAAKEIGLDAANISGAILVPFLSDLLVNAFGDRWLAHGSLTVRFLKPLGLTDFCAFHGTLEESATPGQAKVRIWGVDQRGDQILAATATAPFEPIWEG